MVDENSTSEYRRQNPRSGELMDAAENVLPGGETRTVTFHEPYPTWIKSGEGTTLTTVDGDDIVDFLNNYTQAIHGHAPERVVSAVSERLAEGNGLGAPTEEIINHAEILVGRFPSIEKVRYGNSGTEATMNAIRAALAHTGNERVLKVEGGYHGTHDAVEVSISDHGREHAGIPRAVENRVLTVSFNDPESLKDTFADHGDDLACFIVEPVLGVGGQIPATPEYLETARDLTVSNEVILIFDEVMSSRLSIGGAQKMFGVTPDLTALGKYMGGLLPFGAFGGRAEVMDVFHPTEGSVSHSGTFNGNPATLAGGIVTLEMLDEKTIARINDLGEKLRECVREVGADSDLPLQITGVGSLFNLHFSEGEIEDASPRMGDNEQDAVLKDLHLAMRNRGVFMAPRGMGNVSTPMGSAEIGVFVETLRDALDDVYVGV